MSGFLEDFVWAAYSDEAKSSRPIFVACGCQEATTIHCEGTGGFVTGFFGLHCGSSLYAIFHYRGHKLAFCETNKSAVFYRVRNFITRNNIVQKVKIYSELTTRPAEIIKLIILLACN
jgi:hypothetical protein